MNPTSASPLRLLGLAAMIGAPALLIETARNGFAKVANESTDPTGALLYGLFALGWFCAMLGLHQLRAAGAGRLGRTLTLLPLLTIPLALGQTLMDLLKVPTAHPLYLVTDLAWPLSMVLTFTVSVAVPLAGRLPGWRRLTPLLCGISLPLMLVLLALGIELPGWTFGAHTALGWFALGLALFTLEPRPTLPRPTLA